MPTIRPIENQDILAISQLHHMCFERGWSQKDIKNLLEKEGIFLLAEEKGRIVSCIVVSSVLDESEIVTLMTHPEYRNQHIGEKILQESITSLQKKGTIKIFLEVNENNRAAIGLYKKLGFTICSRRKNYYNNASGAEDALVMELLLKKGNNS